MKQYARRTDEELVEFARNSQDGDTRAFDQLVYRHQRDVLVNCRYLTRSPSDAEDLAQDVFVKAYFALGRFEGRAKFRTWVRRIKINHCLNFLQKRNGRRFVDISDAAVETAPQLHLDPQAERQAMDKETQANIAVVLESMPDSLRVPLVMREFDQLSYQEIADSLGLGLSAVKMRIKRGREHFRAHFDRSQS